MSKIVHLYDPENGISYANKGCFSADHPAPEGFEWRPGQPPKDAPFHKEESDQIKARKVLDALPAQVRAKYRPQLTFIKGAIDDGQWDEVPYLLNEIKPESPEEISAFELIKSNLLGQLSA
jgi:hypothetical protein